MRLLALALGLLLWAAPAFADQMYTSFQFICLPKLSHFSATTLTFDNVDPQNAPRGRELSMDAIYMLANHPYRCAWPGGAITAKLTYYHTAQPSGFCGAVEYGTVEISWNGVPVAKIEQDRCGGDWHAINIDEIVGLKRRAFWIEQCDKEAKSLAGEPTFSCKKTDFDPVTGNLRKLPS
jgi:hypothetical protein